MVGAESCKKCKWTLGPLNCTYKSGKLCVLGFFGCTRFLLLHTAFPSCGKWGLLFVAVLRLLLAVASLVAWRGPYGGPASVVAAPRL